MSTISLALSGAFLLADTQTLTYRQLLSHTRYATTRSHLAPAPQMALSGSFALLGRG